MVFLRSTAFVEDVQIIFDHTQFLKVKKRASGSKHILPVIFNFKQKMRTEVKVLPYKHFEVNIYKENLEASP